MISTHREVFEEEIAPVVLDVEEEAKDEHHVHEADEDDDHHPRVDRHPDLSLCLCHYISEECSECIYEHLVFYTTKRSFQKNTPLSTDRQTQCLFRPHHYADSLHQALGES